VLSLTKSKARVDKVDRWCILHRWQSRQRNPNRYHEHSKHSFPPFLVPPYLRPYPCAVQSYGASRYIRGPRLERRNGQSHRPNQSGNRYGVPSYPERPSATVDCHPRTRPFRLTPQAPPPQEGDFSTLNTDTMKTATISILATAALAAILTHYAPTGRTNPRLIHSDAVQRVQEYVQGRSTWVDEADLYRVPEELRQAAISR
jgi:hypothetical protein